MQYIQILPNVELVKVDLKHFSQEKFSNLGIMLMLTNHYFHSRKIKTDSMLGDHLLPIYSKVLSKN